MQPCNAVAVMCIVHCMQVGAIQDVYQMYNVHVQLYMLNFQIMLTYL